MQCLPPHGPASRRRSAGVMIGGIMVGGGAPIVVQSMTNTDTADIAATVTQVAALARAGSELVRITVDRDGDAPIRLALAERAGGLEEQSCCEQACSKACIETLRGGLGGFQR